MKAGQHSRRSISGMRSRLLLLAAAAAVLALWAPSVQALRCYASILSTRGELQVVQSYVCDDQAAACGSYSRPCTTTTTSGCTKDQVLQGQRTTVYSCFHSVSACQATAQLPSYTVEQCCGSSNCNAPGNAASLPRLSIGLLVAALVAAALALVAAA